MKNFELSLRGYDGGTDETDHLILWVKAESEQAVLDCIRSNGLQELAMLDQQLPIEREGTVDFELPAQAEQFKSRVLELVKEYDKVNPLIKATLELLEDGGGIEKFEFRAFEVLAYHMPDSAHVWADISMQDQVSFAEDFALWSTKRKFGDQRAYRVDIVVATPVGVPSIEKIKQELPRKILRLRQRTAENSKKFDGKEREFTFHGGFSSGYDVGKLAAYEEMADMLNIPIDAIAQAPAMPDFHDFNQADRYNVPVETRLVLALPLMEYRPEAMRVTERKASNGVWFEVETFNAALNKWIQQKDHANESDAIEDAEGWYPNPALAASPKM